VDQLRDQYSTSPHNQRIVVYCQVGQRGDLALRILRQVGFGAINLRGGDKSYPMFLRPRNKVGQRKKPSARFQGNEQRLNKNSNNGAVCEGGIAARTAQVGRC